MGSKALCRLTNENYMKYSSKSYLIQGENSNLTEGTFHQTYSWKIKKGAKVIKVVQKVEN